MEAKQRFVPAMQSFDVASGKVSRPSHITVLRNLRFAEGSGRRKSDSSRADA